MKTRVLPTVVSALLLSLGCATTVLAQQPQAPAAPQPQQAAPSANFSDAELQSFVDVQDDLQAVRTEYSAKVEAAADQTEATSLQEQASAEMLGVLQENGIEVNTYNQIAMALQQDEQLRDRMEAMLE